MKALIQFGKQGRLRYISHLDLQRFMQRALRRSGLPVAYSQGFSPHAIMSFASALGTGISSEAELLEVRMAEDVTQETVFSAMQNALPPEMPVYRVRMVEDRFPALMSMVQCAEYQITLSGEEARKIIDYIPEYLGKQEIFAMRKTKSGEKMVNIRPLTLELSCRSNNVLFARLMLTPQDTLKPDLLINTLANCAGAVSYDVRIHRTQLCAQGCSGAVVSLIDWAE